MTDQEIYDAIKKNPKMSLHEELFTQNIFGETVARSGREMIIENGMVQVIQTADEVDDLLDSIMPANDNFSKIQKTINQETLPKKDGKTITGITTEKLAWFRENGMLLEPRYDPLAVAGDKRKAESDDAKIVNVEVAFDKSTDKNQYFKVKVTLDISTSTDSVLIEINTIKFEAFRDNSLNNLKFYYANVFVNFEEIVPDNLIIPVNVKIINFSTAQIKDEKSINFKIDIDGLVKQTDDNIKPKIDNVNVKNNIDIDFFIENYVIYFGLITPQKTNSLTRVLLGVEKYYNEENKNINVYHLAYMLATIEHETGSTYNPVEEANWLVWKSRQKYFEKMYDPILGNPENRKKMAIKNGNTTQGDGAKYFGRGYVQITWKNNYKKMQNKFGVPLVKYPSLALENELAIKILIYGSETGYFTGIKLSDHINDLKKDYLNARKVINGLDKAKIIEGHANKIEKCIKISK